MINRMRVISLAISGSAKICLGGLLTSSVFIMQTFCVFFPVLGTLFSAACTILVAVAAVLLKRHAVLVYLSAGILILAISPRSALEFLMTTGFAGLALGLWIEKIHVLSLLISSIGMFTGLCFLTYLLGTATLGGLFAGLPVVTCLPLYAVFSAAYSVLWFYVLKKWLRKAIHKYCYQYSP